jgi:hypothetical protein
MEISRFGVLAFQGVDDLFSGFTRATLTVDL